jgi:lipoyl(octanoyl) transferase
VKGEIEDILFLLEHPNTYTLGKTSDRENLKGSIDYLKSNRISVYDIDRGGDITYHGPGQIVGYPIIDLNNWQKDTHKYLRALEEVIIKTCAEYNLICERNPKHTGVWINEAKIAAIGIKVSRWVTMHGFAFNINTDLNLFNGIIPCGIQDKSVTSLKRELNREVDISEVKEKIVKNFKEIFSYNKVVSKKLAEIVQSNLVNI